MSEDKKTNCLECGECLARCPYVRMTPGRARREMRALRRGGYSVLLERCAGCATCEAVCHGDCKPYSLIRQRWHERYMREGLPERARFMLPHSEPNFRTAVKLSPAEQAAVDNLKAIPSGPRALYSGCNALLLPSQLESRMFAGLDVFGAFEYCCGEMYYRMGLFEHARQCGLRLQKLLEGSNIEEIVFVCSACWNMFSNIYPNELGVELKFKKTFAADWLLEKIRGRELEVKRPLRMKVAVHDSCHAKLTGGGIWESTRALLEAVGAEPVECRHTREESLCCGVAAACSSFSPLDLAGAAARRLIEFDLSGANTAAAYCNGCFLTLASMRHIVPTRTPVAPLWELVQRAIGERTDPAASRKRSAQVLLGVIANAAPGLLQPLKRFRPDPIDPL